MILKIIIHSQCRVTRSFNHLVGAQQNRRRQRDTDQLRGLQIRHELESRGPLRRQRDEGVIQAPRLHRLQMGRLTQFEAVFAVIRATQGRVMVIAAAASRGVGNSPTQ
jgi:hypothetical protein